MTTATKTRERWGLCPRISRDDFKDGLGVERQFASMSPYSKANDSHCVEDIEKEHSMPASTYATKKRKRFEEALAACKAGSSDGLLFLEMSRFTRDPLIAEGIIRERKAGAKLRIATVHGG